MSELFDKKQAAEFLGVSVNTITDYISKKRLSPQKVKGVNYFSDRDPYGL